MEATTKFFSSVALILAFRFLSKRVLTVKKIPNLNHPPSVPWALPIIGHLHLFKLPLHRTLARIAARHGPLLFLRLGAQRVLLVTSPDIAEECFTKNDVVFANRPYSENGKHLSYDYTILGAAPYGPHWINLRRITHKEFFSPTRLTALSYIRANEVRLLARQLFQAPTASINGYRKLEMRTTSKELILNIIVQMCIGKRYFGEAATASAQEGRRFIHIVDELFSLCEVSSIEDILPFTRWLGLGRRYKKRLINFEKEMDGLFQEMVDEHRRGQQEPEAEEGRQHKDLLNVLLSLQESDANFYTDQVIKGIILNLLLGSTETISEALEWALSLLLNNPTTLKKLRGEIETQVGVKRLVADSDLPNLPYLNDVIKETLRLFPPGPLLIPHQSSIECKIRGYDIPAGTFLFVNEFAINRDPTLWTQPTKFEPERFEAGEGEGYNFIPFGSGRRRCPGETFALRVVGLTLGTLIHCFEWERVGEMEVDLTEGGTMSMFKAIPLQAMYKPHKDMINILLEL